jgi:hypothetical protein
MNITSILRPRTLVAFAVSLVLAVSAYGFAAANTVEKSAAGDGETTISGYAVENITYALNATDPSTVDTITFDVVPATGLAVPTTVKFKIGTSTWYAASHGLVNSWSYDASLAPIDVTDFTNLQVVATGPAT